MDRSDHAVMMGGRALVLIVPNMSGGSKWCNHYLVL
jgi:hypothetical protein